MACLTPLCSFSYRLVSYGGTRCCAETTQRFKPKGNVDKINHNTKPRRLKDGKLCHVSLPRGLVPRQYGMPPLRASSWHGSNATGCGGVPTSVWIRLKNLFLGGVAAPHGVQNSGPDNTNNSHLNKRALQSMTRRTIFGSCLPPSTASSPRWHYSPWLHMPRTHDVQVLDAAPLACDGLVKS